LLVYLYLFTLRYILMDIVLCLNMIYTDMYYSIEDRFGMSFSKPPLNCYPGNRFRLTMQLPC
jgi:hypothetical protein